MDTPFLDFYKECMETGRIPKGGLCNSFTYDQEDNFLALLAPSREENPEHYVDGFAGYWGYDGEPLSSHVSRHQKECSDRGICTEDSRSAFTPFRQTIVLFCAAINGEL